MTTTWSLKSTDPSSSTCSCQPSPLREDVKRTWLDAQTALVKLVRNVENVDSMIGKMPPACETYLNIESYTPNETKKERDLRISRAAARMIETHLRSWTKVLADSEAEQAYKTVVEMLDTASRSDLTATTTIKETSTTGKGHSQMPATESRTFAQDLADIKYFADTKSSPSASRDSSASSIRQGTPNDAKPCLKRKKSVTWDPSLDEKHGTPDSSIERDGAVEGDPPSYNMHFTGYKIPDRAITQALEAIEIHYQEIQPGCLEFLDPRSALLKGYSHEKEYRRLSESLMTKVLEQLDSLSIDPLEEDSRRKRKELARDASDMLQVMDAFILDHRKTTPPARSADTKTSLQSYRTKPHKPPTNPSPRTPSSEPPISPQSPCLGYKTLTFTPHELLTGGLLTLYIPHPPFGLPQLIANFYIRVPPGCIPGDHIRARLLNPRNLWEQEVYFDVELLAGESASGGGRSRRREGVPDICFCEEERDPLEGRRELRASYDPHDGASYSVPRRTNGASHMADLRPRTPNSRDCIGGARKHADCGCHRRC